MARSRYTTLLLRIGSLSVALLAASGCGTASIQANRSTDFDEYDDPAMLALSPDAFADRLGEPDEWRQVGEGANLRMVAVWKCLDGKRREIVWRRQVGEGGREYWNVVRDDTRAGECE